MRNSCPKEPQCNRFSSNPDDYCEHCIKRIVAAVSAGGNFKLMKVIDCWEMDDDVKSVFDEWLEENGNVDNYYDDSYHEFTVFPHDSKLFNLGSNKKIAVLNQWFINIGCEMGEDVLVKNSGV